MSIQTPVNQFFETPLAVAIAAGASKEVHRLLKDGAASSIFVKGSSSNSILCTMPNAVKPESAVVTHSPPLLSIPPDIIELVDESLAQFMNMALHTNVIASKKPFDEDNISVQDPLADPSKKAERFRVGDVVKLRPSSRFSSFVGQGLCTI